MKSGKSISMRKNIRINLLDLFTGKWGVDRTHSMCRMCACIHSRSLKWGSTDQLLRRSAHLSKDRREELDALRSAITLQKISDYLLWTRIIW